MHFWIAHQIFNSLKERMSLRAQVTVKLFTWKNVLAQLPERLRFRTPSTKQRANASKTLMKSASSTFLWLPHQSVRHGTGKYPSW